MLEETADDVAQADVLAEALHAGEEAARGADDEVGFHAGLGGGVQVVDRRLVHELVHLRDNPRRLARGGVGGLVGDQVLDPDVQIERGDEQVLELGRAAEAGQGVEELGHLLGQVLAGGEETDVGVEPRSLRVVVAGPEMDVAAQSAALAPDHQAALAVGLVADEPVHDMHAGFLQLTGPVDVVGLVEPRLELDQRGDLLAVHRGVHQGAHDWRVAAGAVERHLDGHHIVIERGLLDEVDHAGETVVGQQAPGMKS